jgi:hypothetical protein
MGWSWGDLLGSWNPFGSELCLFCRSDGSDGKRHGFLCNVNMTMCTDYIS